MGRRLIGEGQGVFCEKEGECSFKEEDGFVFSRQRRRALRFGDCRWRLRYRARRDRRALRQRPDFVAQGADLLLNKTLDVCPELDHPALEGLGQLLALPRLDKEDGRDEDDEIDREDEE